jgi:hypothetical protein
MGPVRQLAERLMEIPGVVAVTLGGSRPGGVIHPDSDWDFGLHYRDAIRADDVRALGFEGTVVEPGASSGRHASLKVPQNRELGHGDARGLVEPRLARVRCGLQQLAVA